MQRIDHSMIFVLVAATYTPFLLEAFDGWQRVATVGGIWIAAGTCILLRNVARDLGRGAMTAMYLGLGWLAVAFLPLFVPLLGFELVVLIAAGGLLYTVGAVVYATRRPNPLPRYFGFHEVFHTFVIAAATIHYVAVWQLTG
jgi:hemolysin III